MERSIAGRLRIGDWSVDPVSSQISRHGETARVEARTMRLLLCLAEHAGEVVSIDDLLTRVWPDVTVAPDSVYQAVTSLRRLLGDDPKQPTYIATVPRLGYRMVATVSPWTDQPELQTGSPSKATDANVAPPRNARPRTGVILGASCLVVAAFLFAIQFRGKPSGNGHVAASSAPQVSIAVLPFLDLTEGMREEEFADGMTEELIGKLSQIPGFHVPAPTSSFYFKEKKLPVADIAKSLGVVYVLDGSVRKSGNRLRVSARLMRADDSFVLWSESYDRPFGDILKVQDEIAGEVTKSLRTSMGISANGR